ncbi:MAG: hypothetical protein HY609_03915 [Deltaproteobacteria bacterium]|nr:hypothetical protein [Deltaproteobacteria bacterium]MBI4224055.1 hypothetical protein [Deltaproteobacteria bacterium]
MQEQIKKWIAGAIFLVLLHSPAAVFAGEKRDIEVDREIRGAEIKKGSLVSKPGSQSEAHKKTVSPPLPRKDEENRVTPDTIGEAENKTIFKLDLEGEGVTSIEEDVKRTPEVVREEVREEIREEKEPMTAEKEETVAEETVPEESTGGETPLEETVVEEPESPILDAEADVNLKSGTVETDVTVDTSGELEEREILDADVAVEETTVEAEVGSATDITGEELVENADITTEPVATAVPPPADVSADIDTTGETTGGEGDVGIEAEVSDVSESEDEACDPVDGLTSDTCIAPLP